MNPLNAGSNQFAPLATDPLPVLLSKAEGMLAWVTANETMLRKFPAGAVDERRALWQPLAALITRAMSQPELADDARLEAQRVWAEEMRLSALVVITDCVHLRADAVRRRFATNAASAQELDNLIAGMELARPIALKLLGKEDLDALREHGFLRTGE